MENGFKLNRDKMELLQRWTGILGIIFIISGVINALLGAFFFLVGAIPGIISIILGVKLRGARKYAKEYLETNNSYSLDLLVAELTTFFKIQGVFTIVMAILSFLIGLLGGLGALAMY